MGAQMNDWQELLARLEIIGVPDSVSVPKSTSQTFIDFESMSRYRLPESYKSFMHVIGPGEIAEDYRIRGPGFALPGKSIDIVTFNEQVDLSYFNERIRQKDRPVNETVVNRYFPADAERILRLIYFATNANGELVGWDPLDIRDEQKMEYGVYIKIQEFNCLSLLSDSFSAFVHEVCLGRGYQKILNDTTEYPDLHPPVFRPATFVPIKRRK